MQMRTAVFLSLIVHGCAWGDSFRLPISFEPNRGQAAKGADYVTRTHGNVLALNSHSAVLTFGGSHLATVLTGARTDAQAEAEAPLPGVVNYLVGRDRSHWLTGIP